MENDEPRGGRYALSRAQYDDDVDDQPLVVRHSHELSTRGLITPAVPLVASKALSVESGNRESDASSACDPLTSCSPLAQRVRSPPLARDGERDAEAPRVPAALLPSGCV